MLVQIPATLVLGGLAVALFGWLPRFTSLAWAALVVALLLGQLGQLLQLPQWLMDVSPYTHMPLVPIAGRPVDAADRADRRRGRVDRRRDRRVPAPGRALTSTCTDPVRQERYSTVVADCAASSPRAWARATARSADSGSSPRAPAA